MRFQDGSIPCCRMATHCQKHLPRVNINRADGSTEAAKTAGKRVHCAALFLPQPGVGNLFRRPVLFEKSAFFDADTTLYAAGRYFPARRFRSVSGSVFHQYWIFRLFFLHRSLAAKKKQPRINSAAAAIKAWYVQKRRRGYFLSHLPDLSWIHSPGFAFSDIWIARLSPTSSAEVFCCLAMAL